MKPNDRKAFLETVIGFAELKGKQLSAPALELYWRSLQHWPLSEFRLAAEQLLRTCEFMPVPKDFEDLRKAGRPTAGEAWSRVRQCARDGLTSSGDDFIDRAAMVLGGYRAIGLTDTDKMSFLERRFCEHFESMQDAGDVREAVPEIAYSSTERLSGPQSIHGLLGRFPHEPTP